VIKNVKKKTLIGLFVTLLAFSFPVISWGSMLSGELVKIQGSVYTIKDDSGREQQVKVDQSTVKQGQIKEGTRVEVEVDDMTGNAKSIKPKA
jgi:hypothetical protein